MIIEWEYYIGLAIRDRLSKLALIVATTSPNVTSPAKAVCPDEHFAKEVQAG